MKILIITIIALLIILLSVLIHCIILKRKCLYKDMINTKRIKVVKNKKFIPHYHIKFVSGKILGLIPCWVYWQKDDPFGYKKKHKVSEYQAWVLAKVQEIKKNNPDDIDSKKYKLFLGYLKLDQFSSINKAKKYAKECGLSGIFNLIGNNYRETWYVPSWDEEHKKKSKNKKSKK